MEFGVFERGESNRKDQSKEGSSGFDGDNKKEEGSDVINNAKLSRESSQTSTSSKTTS